MQTASNPIVQRLEAGIAAHTAGRLDEAEARYREILAEAPDFAEAMRFLGVLRHQQGHSDEGIAWLQRAIAAQPSAAAHNDLGNILVQRGELQAAGEAFLAAVELDSGEPNHWNNLGSVLRRLERHADAEEAYRAALAVAPEFAPALNNLGELYTALGQPEVGAEYYCRAYILPPLEGKPWEMLGVAHYRLGDIAAAAEAYRQWAEAEPDNPRARHMHAACLGGSGPERASDAFVEKTFDAYAEDFENRLVGSLGYCGPQRVAAMLERFVAPAGSLAVLDGGCGTGLCGPLLAPYATRLTGVDLSANMLAKARARGCYDVLEKAELGTYLAAHPDSYDLIVMADTVIYFGDLSALFEAATRALRPGGCFVFTTETCDESDACNTYRITPSGRYSHAPDYLAALLGRTGCTVMAMQPESLRREFGTPVAGVIVAARRTD
ncbi:MAG TPA: tetratricopeptide repeat protein [Rhodocyclaceae bacterium]|nr:tetratricopeptide repeat protein [Rhodocyclaceae bacterium]